MLIADLQTWSGLRRCGPAIAVAVAIGALTAGCSPKSEALYARAQQSLAKGEVGAAVIDLKNFVEAEPQNATARALLAEVALQSGDIQTADIEIRKAKDLGAAEALTIGTECRLMAVQGKAEKVLTDCVADKAPPEALARVLIARGKAQMQLYRPADAKAEFDAAAKAEPGNLEARVGQASAVYEISGLSAALGLLDGASDAAKDRPGYWLAVGQINARAKDYAAAEKAFATALDKSEHAGAASDKVAALVGLGEAQLRQAKVKEASATGDKLARAAPNNSYVKIVRAQIAAGAGDMEKAGMLLRGRARQATRQCAGTNAARHGQHATGQPRSSRDELRGRRGQ